MSRWYELVEPKMELLTELDIRYQDQVDENMKLRYDRLMSRWYALVEPKMEYPTELDIRYQEQVDENMKLKYDRLVKDWNEMVGEKMEKLRDIRREEAERRLNRFLDEERDTVIMEEITKFMDALDKELIRMEMRWKQFIVRRGGEGMYYIMYPYISAGGFAMESNIMSSTREKIAEYLYMINTGLYAMNDVGIPVSII